ncbi:MAG: ATP-binding protein [Trueperaceae bacterium]|nr:ATP-binding protein [Trueperaceae bacterium]
MERKLERAWVSDKRFSSALRAISLSGTAGIRGLANVEVRFDYPITVISGRNGAGKSTILALAMLAYSDPDRKTKASIVPARTPNRSARRARKSYQDFVFSDFFFKGLTDPEVSGVDINWEFADGAELTIRKQTNKWMRYERRPGKYVSYLGISRCVPAIEQRTLRNKFSGSRVVKPTANLDQEYIQRLSQIMGMEFSDAHVYGDERYGLRVLRSDATYSGFNMGAGEDSVVQVLYALQSAKPGSILGIEEVELGIHPSALRRLAQHMVEISIDKGLQIVTTSHSEHYIDALPRVSRILLQRGGGRVYVIPKPTSRMAVSALTNSNQQELAIYVEDRVARQLVANALESDLRVRVGIEPIGSKDSFRTVGKFLHQSSPRARCLYLFDGDVRDSEIRDFYRALSEEECLGLPAQGDFGVAPLSHESYHWVGRLPGVEAPEAWLLATVAGSQVGLDCLAEQLELSRGASEARYLLDEISVTARDHHDLFHFLGLRSNHEADVCRDAMIRAALRAMPELKAQINDAVRTVLEGAPMRSTRVHVVAN